MNISAQAKSSPPQTNISTANSLRSILLIGIGNPLRCDDGIGEHVVRLIEREGFPSIRTEVVHQLSLELLEEAIGYDCVICVDAANQREDVSLKKIENVSDRQIVSSHHLSCELFVLLAQKIYNTALNLRVCSIRGTNFELGDKISSETLNSADQAVNLISNFIKAYA